MAIFRAEIKRRPRHLGTSPSALRSGRTFGRRIHQSTHQYPHGLTEVGGLKEIFLTNLVKIQTLT